MKGKLKENQFSPRATRSSKKKHFVSRFAGEGKLGSVRKSTMAELKSNLSDIRAEMDSTVSIRPLGPLRSIGIRESQESLLSGETYFVEAHQTESELTSLQHALRKQEALCAAKQVSISQLNSQVSVLANKLSTVTTELAAVQAEVNLLRMNPVYTEEGKFTVVGMEMSVRAFTDHILSTVYVRAGLGVGHSDAALADWLRSSDAPLLFQGQNSITLFGEELLLEDSFLTVLRSFKSISSHISRTYAHSSEPVLVAAALNNLQYREDHELAKLFKKIFKHSFTDMVNKHETGRLTEEETTCFSKRFSSRA